MRAPGGENFTGSGIELQISRGAREEEAEATLTYLAMISVPTKRLSGIGERALFVGGRHLRTLRTLVLRSRVLKEEAKQNNAVCAER